MRHLMNIMSYRPLIPDRAISRLLLHDEADETENAAGDHAAAATKGCAGVMDMQHLRECAERAFSYATDSQPYPLESGWSE